MEILQRAQSFLRAFTFSGTLEPGRLEGWKFKVGTCWQTCWHHIKPENEECGRMKTNSSEGTERP